MPNKSSSTHTTAVLRCSLALLGAGIPIAVVFLWIRLWIAQKILFAYIKSDDISNSDKMFNRLSTQSSVEAMVDDHEDEQEIWTFFFNHNGGHKYLKLSKRDKIQRRIFGRVGTDLLKTMLQNGNYNFYTFYDDDIYQYMKQSNASDATRALVEKICNGGDEI